MTTLTTNTIATPISRIQITRFRRLPLLQYRSPANGLEVSNPKAAFWRADRLTVPLVTTDLQESETAETTGNTHLCGASALNQVGRPVATRTSSPASSFSNPVDTLPVAAPSLQTEPPISEDHNNLHDQVTNTSCQPRPVSAADSVSSVPRVNLGTTPPNRHRPLRGSDVKGQPSAPASHHHDGLGHGGVNESAPAQRTTTEPGNSSRSQRSSSDDSKRHHPSTNNCRRVSVPSTLHQTDRACIEES